LHADDLFELLEKLATAEKIDAASERVTDRLFAVSTRIVAAAYRRHRESTVK
jgi:hypothetical protein